MPSYYPYPYFYQAPQVQTPQAQYPPMQQQAVSGAQAPQMQIQDGGFISVPNEDIAKNYPVAPGRCVTFKIEGKPIVMEKSMGFSQLEAPHIDTYRLVKEEVAEQPETHQNETIEPRVDNSAIDELKGEIRAIWSEIEDIKNARPKPMAKQTPAKRDKDGDD